MNKFSKHNNSIKRGNIFLLFIFILMTNVSVFSQSSESSNAVVSAINDRTVNEVEQDNKAAANVEFVLWFMGSKQDPNSTISNEGINTKKQIMTSGLAPNRLLIKAFLKKAVNFEIAIA
jgi:hypothetical protein